MKGTISKLTMAMGLTLSILLNASMTSAEDVPPTKEKEFNTNPTYLIISPRKNQTKEQQKNDQLECFNKATELLEWDPYLVYDELVAQGYARALSRQNMKETLVDVAIAAAIAGEVADEVAGDITGPIEETGIGEVGGTIQEAATGAAIGAALASVDFSFLNEPDDPEAQRVVSRFERNLNKWEKKYSACLKRKGYKVQASDY